MSCSIAVAMLGDCPVV